MRTYLVVVTLTLSIVLGTPILPGGLAGATDSYEARLLILTNQTRASVGAPPLTLDPTISPVARAWAQTMADQGAISHNPNRGAQLSGWSRSAENVAFGPDVDWVHQALVTSPAHHRNLTDPGYSLVGIGVVSSGGQVFVVENFVRPTEGSARIVVPSPQLRVPPLPPPAVRPATTTTLPESTPPPRVEASPAAPARQPPAVPAPSRLAFVLVTLRALDDRSGRR